MQTLTLSGWTQPVDALQSIVADAIAFDYSEYSDARSAIAALAQYRDIETIVAWSMGAQLVIKALADRALAPKKLILMAAPFQFVSTPDFTHGMDPITFSQFRENYASNPKRTSERFHNLVAKGDKEPKRIASALSHHSHVHDAARWLPWLDALGVDSLKGMQVEAVPHTVLIHGDMDAIVPVAQATHIHAMMPKSALKIWQGVAHAPHLHDAERIKSYLAMA